MAHTTSSAATEAQRARLAALLADGPSRMWRAAEPSARTFDAAGTWQTAVKEGVVSVAFQTQEEVGANGELGIGSMRAHVSLPEEDGSVTTVVVDGDAGSAMWRTVTAAAKSWPAERTESVIS